MTDLKYEILERLYLESEKTHISESELLNPFVSKKNNDVNSAKHALNQMIEQGYVTRLPDGSYRIAIPGINIYEAEHAARLKEQAAIRAALITAEQERAQRTKQERQQRFDNKMKVTSILVTIIIFFLGLISDHAFGIIDWIISLFKYFSH